ncbi:MAG: lamin tail domain-containing protein, partial [Verrucomicrobiota bacterium]
INLPENKRLFYGHLNDLIENAFNTEAMGPWIAHLNERTGNNYDQRFLNYIERRANHVETDIRTKVPSNFQIVSNRGLDFETDSPVITLEGTGGFKVRSVRNETTGQPLDLRWKGLNEWEAEIPLATGDNVINLQAFDFRGNPIGSIFSPGTDRITVTNSGTVEAASSRNLIISEIHYHPGGETEDGEFIELLNTGHSPIDLAGIRFTRGVAWEQPTEPPSIIQPGARVLLVNNPATFESVFGSYGDSNLANGGEMLRLEDRVGNLIQELRYNDRLPWPVEADGLGHSLVFRSGDGTSPYHWRRSAEIGGSPGTEDSRSDRRLEERPLRVDDRGRLQFRYPTMADQIEWTLQGSRDLEAWEVVEKQLHLESRIEDDESGDTILRWTPDPDLFYYRIQYRKSP